MWGRGLAASIFAKGHGVRGAARLAHLGGRRSASAGSIPRAPQTMAPAGPDCRHRHRRAASTPGGGDAWSTHATASAAPRWYSHRCILLCDPRRGLEPPATPQASEKALLLAVKTPMGLQTRSLCYGLHFGAIDAIVDPALNVASPTDDALPLLIRAISWRCGRRYIWGGLNQAGVPCTSPRRRSLEARADRGHQVFSEFRVEEEPQSSAGLTTTGTLQPGP